MNKTDKSSLEAVINQAKEGFINTLVFALEARDRYTKGHSQRVAFYAKLISEMLNMGPSMQKQIYTGGIMHDIGKIGIPDAVLFKPGRLSENEYEMVKYHSIFSYHIVKKIKGLKDVWVYPVMVRGHLYRTFQ